MSLRITHGNLYRQALGDIQGSLSQYSRLQAQVATGKRVNRPSDDPIAALRIIPLGNDIRNLKQFGENITLSREVLDTGAASLEDASSLMQRVRELTMQASNGTVSDSDRTSIGAEVEQLLNQLVGIANSKRADRYLFAGTADNQEPFRMVTDGGGSRVVYQGNRQRIAVEVAPGLRSELNLPGDSVFQARNRQPAQFSGGNTGAVPTGAGDTGAGYQELLVTYNGLHTDRPSTVTAGSGATTALGRLAYTFTASPATLSVGGGPALALPVSNTDFTTADGRTINLTVTGVPATLTGTFTSKAGLSTDGGATVRDVTDFASPNAAVRNSYDGTVLNVDVRNITRPGTELVTHPGTFDSFTVLGALRDLLFNQDNLPTNEVRDRISGLLAEVDAAHDGILDGLRELGFRSSSMEVVNSRVQNLQISRSESLSRVEDADIAESILSLQRQDIAYQAALQISSRVMQTSLASILR